MFKKVCVILTSLCLLTACSVNEDLVKDKEAKRKDEKTSEVSKNTASKVSEEKKEKESFKSSDESSSKKETSKQNEAPAQKKEASSASNKETSNKTAVAKSESAPVKEETSSDSSISAPPENEVTQTEPQPEPSVPSTPPAVCPGGFDPSLPCDFISDGNYYFATFASEGEAFAQGQYYLDQVMYIGQQEITNYSVQSVYRNDQAIAYYGLNLWSNGVMIY